MTGWSVMLRGIRYRSGRSLVVVLLAAFATLAAVLAPAYGRAAAQSVLTDAVLAAPPTAVALTVSAESSAAQGGAFDPARQSVVEATTLTDAELAEAPALRAVLDRPVTSVETDAQLVLPGEQRFASLLTWRLGVCGQLNVTGDCAIDAEQAVMSVRSAAETGVEVGDTVTVQAARGGQSRRVEIVGLYTPKDSGSVYWGNSVYFAHAPGQRLDAVFTGAEDDVKLPGGIVTAKITYPLKPEPVRLDAVADLRSELGALSLGLDAAELRLQTALLSIVDDVAADQAALSRAVPLIAIPLLLLAFAVLFLIVAALGEERGPELALARLRGYPAAGAARFGLGETLLLIALGAPVGLLAGLGLVELTARTMLADGVHVEPRWPVFAAAAAALLFAGLAAWLATRKTLTAGVLSLFRRVPQRVSKRANAAEAVVATLALVGLVAALRDRSGPFALLAPAALALLAGLLAGRLLVWWARLRLVIARRRGHLPGILASAQLARRPGTARVVVVLTSAVALLGFAAASWDVAARARERHANDTLGATTVYVVSAAHPQALMAAVGAADPSGRSMAVVRTDEPYAQGRVELIGVQSSLLPNVALWQGKDPAELTRLGERLREGAPKPALLGEDVTLDVTLPAGMTPVRLGAVVAAPGQPPSVAWGPALTAGRRQYPIGLPACSGCHFAGVAIGRAAGASGPIRASFTLHGVRSGGAVIGTEDARWTPLTERTPGARAAVSGGGFSVESSGPSDVIVSYSDGPDRLPAVLAGAPPGDGETFTFPGFGDVQQRFTVVAREAALPRAGAHGLLFDLDLAVRSASATTGLAEAADLRYEVWAAGDAAVGMAGKLADRGVRVLHTRTMAEEVEQLGRRAPALGFRLYLLAGVAAALLALGVVALSRRLGAAERQAELAALRATGVRAAVLRRALRRERLAGLALPLLLGLAAGIGSALLMLPGIPLVTARALTPIDLWPAAPPRLELLPLTGLGALVVVLLGLLTAGRLARGGVR